MTTIKSRIDKLENCTAKAKGPGPEELANMTSQERYLAMLAIPAPKQTTPVRKLTPDQAYAAMLGIPAA